MVSDINLIIFEFIEKLAIKSFGIDSPNKFVFYNNKGSVRFGRFVVEVDGKVYPDSVDIGFDISFEKLNTTESALYSYNSPFITSRVYFLSDPRFFNKLGGLVSKIFTRFTEGYYDKLIEDRLNIRRAKN